jgi:hypothetical protein
VRAVEESLPELVAVVLVWELIFLVVGLVFKLSSSRPWGLAVVYNQSIASKYRPFVKTKVLLFNDTGKSWQERNQKEIETKVGFGSIFCKLLSLLPLAESGGCVFPIF